MISVERARRVETREGDASRSAVLTFIEKCQREEDIADLLQDFAKLIDRFGFRRFAVANLWQIEEVKITPGIAASNFSHNDLLEYSELGLGKSDPVWQGALTSPHPFRYRDAWAGRGEMAQPAIRAYYRRVGIHDGLGIPVFNERFERSLVMLTSDEAISASDDELAFLGLAVIVFRRSVAARVLDVSNRRGTELLTPREREILRWIAAGKSAWEVSEILDLSEKTVARHLLNVRTKLRASNTVHAVAEAIRSREIAL